MTGQQLAEPNPPPEPSLLPDALLSLRVNLDYAKFLDNATLSAVQKYRRAALYVAAAMIYLRHNTLLSKPLSKEDIKPRLLGEQKLLVDGPVLTVVSYDQKVIGVHAQD